MRPIRHHVLPIILTMIALAFAGCDRKPVVPSVMAKNDSSAASAMPATVALPNFTALVKKEGPAVINISTEPGQIGLTLRELTRNEQRALHTDGFLVVDAASGVAAESGSIRVTSSLPSTASASPASSSFALNWPKPASAPRCWCSARAT